MDLATLDNLAANQESGAKLKITHPVSGQSLGITMTVIGYGSDQVRKLQRRQANERLKNARKRPTAEDFERASLEVASAAVTGWKFAEGVTLDGVVPEFTKENVERLMKRFPFVLEQVDSFASDQANYLEAA